MIIQLTQKKFQKSTNGHIKSLEKIAGYFQTGEHDFYTDDTWALKCYEYAASENSVFSLIKLAEFYEKGIGTDIDLNSSLKNYQNALELIDNNDTRRPEIDRKIREISDKLRTLKLKKVPLNISKELIQIQFKNIESIDIQKDQTIIIKFNTQEDVNEAVSKIKKMKKDKYKFERFQIKKVNIKRFDSLENNLTRLNLNSNSIGEGNFSEVFIVYKDGEEVPYVAKVFGKQLIDDFSNDVFLVNSFKREVIMSSKFKDIPLIVQYVGFNEYSLTDYLQDKGRVYEIKPTLLMRYVHGRNLEDAITKKESEWWDDTKKLKIIIGIAAALSIIHKNNIIHRDIKPSNILLDENSEPVICDFGSSRQYSFLADNNQNFSTNVDTNIYMAPECFGINAKAF